MSVGLRFFHSHEGYKTRELLDSPCNVRIGTSCARMFLEKWRWDILTFEIIAHRLNGWMICEEFILSVNLIVSIYVICSLETIKYLLALCQLPSCLESDSSSS